MTFPVPSDALLKCQPVMNRRPWATDPHPSIAAPFNLLTRILPRIRVNTFSCPRSRLYRETSACSSIFLMSDRRYRMPRPILRHGNIPARSRRLRVSMEHIQRSARERRFRCLVSVCLCIPENITQKLQSRVVVWQTDLTHAPPGNGQVRVNTSGQKSIRDRKGRIVCVAPLR